MSKFEGIKKAWVSGKGNNCAIVIIDGAERMAFDPVVGVIRNLAPGSEVVVEETPNNKPDGAPILKSLRVTKAAVGPVSAGGSPLAPSTYKSRKDSPEVQLSIFMGYAKDLVVAGIAKPAFTTPESVAETVVLYALGLKAAFDKQLKTETVTDPT